MAESRLSRRAVNQGKKQLYTSLGAIAAIIIFAVTLGPTLIGVTGNFIDKITGKSGQQAAIRSDAAVQAPRLDPIPNATPSARINITGRADYQTGKIELFVNGRKTDQAEIYDTQTFEFEDVGLSEGANFIKARVILGDKKSDFSEELSISYTKKAPKLEISHPSDNQKFTKADQQITVRGTTDPDNTVSVNGFIAIVESNGNFTYDLRLNDGENKVKIAAVNSAGNTTEKELTVSYSP